VHRKRSELVPINWNFHHDIALPCKALSVKQFLTKKLITEMEHLSFSPDLALIDFWLFLKIKLKITSLSKL